jgi:hypothetical protein
MNSQEWICFRDKCELRHVSHGNSPDACGVKEDNGAGGEWVVYHGDCCQPACERFKEANNENTGI